MCLDDLSQRPECDPFAIRQGSDPAAIDDSGRWSMYPNSSADPALAQTRLAHDRDQLHRLGRHRLVKDALRQREVDRATDER